MKRLYEKLWKYVSWRVKRAATVLPPALGLVRVNVEDSVAGPYYSTTRDDLVVLRERLAIHTEKRLKEDEMVR